MLEVRSDHNRHMVCVFNRGPKITYFVGIDGPHLNVCKEENEKFERIYGVVLSKTATGLPYTPLDFAMAYMRDPAARTMIPIAPAAIRVLTAIIKGQQPEGTDEATLNHLEITMAAAKEETGFRKPDGPVAQIHKYLDTRIEAVKKQTVSRKELIEKLTEKGFAEGTVVTQCGVWARTNGVTFARPAAAAETKKNSRAKK
jgi:hypothetical protein